MKITPDLEVWLVSDPEMSSAWRQLAKQLSLQSCIPRLEITNRRKLRKDSDKLGEVLRLWRHHHPEEYNVATLLHVLDIMGMKSMYEWVELMTKERLDLDGIETYVSRCNTPYLPRSRSNTPHSHTYYHTHLSLSPVPSDPEDLNSSFSHSNSSYSPPIRPKQNHFHRHSSPSGGVFSTLYRPGPPTHSTPIKVSQHNHHSIRNPTIHINNSTRAGQQQATQLRKLSHRHSSYVAPLITLDTGTPTPDSKRQSSVLDQFDEAFADYKQMKINRNNIETERYFDNLAALLRDL